MYHVVDRDIRIAGPGAGFIHQFFSGEEGGMLLLDIVCLRHPGSSDGAWTRVTMGGCGECGSGGWRWRGSGRSSGAGPRGKGRVEIGDVTVTRCSRPRSARLLLYRHILPYISVPHCMYILPLSLCLHVAQHTQLLPTLPLFKRPTRYCTQRMRQTRPSAGADTADRAAPFPPSSPVMLPRHSRRRPPSVARQHRRPLAPPH